jgi:hypothetical protein
LSRRPETATLEIMSDVPDPLPMRCPRCPVRLPRSEMVRHLWVQHGLLLDGARVREPWEIIEDLLTAYAKRKDIALLARCFELADHADPRQGAERVRLRLQARGLRPAGDEALRQAQESGSTLCPRCRAEMPVPGDPAPRPLTVSRGRLAGAGYVVEVSESGTVPVLEVRTPSVVLQSGPEAGQGFTLRTLLVMLAAPPLVLASIVAVLANLVGQSGIAAVVVLLWLALMAYLFVRVREQFVGKAVDRAVDHAWSLLVPQLFLRGVQRDETDFLAGLALVSPGRGHSVLRAEAVQHLLAVVETALRAGQATPGHLAALQRLEAEDSAATGGDFVPLVAHHVGNCLSGSLPLAVAERLLEEWESKHWTRGQLARLRVLIADRAFALGWTVIDLVELGRVAPALGEVLGNEDEAGLARLRLLWTMRSSRPWVRTGPAVPVFELAQQAATGVPLLERRPDLLLLPEKHVELCSEGLRCAGLLLSEKPPSITLENTAQGFVLGAGPHRVVFAEEPEDLAWHLERWCRWWFDDFLPQATPEPKPSTAAVQWRERLAVTCPECGQRLLSCVGEVGIPFNG